MLSLDLCHVSFYLLLLSDMLTSWYFMFFPSIPLRSQTKLTRKLFWIFYRGMGKKSPTKTVQCLSSPEACIIKFVRYHKASVQRIRSKCSNSQTDHRKKIIISTRSLQGQNLRFLYVSYIHYHDNYVRLKGIVYHTKILMTGDYSCKVIAPLHSCSFLRIPDTIDIFYTLIPSLQPTWGNFVNIQSY